MQHKTVWWCSNRKFSVRGKVYVDSSWEKTQQCDNTAQPCRSLHCNEMKWWKKQIKITSGLFPNFLWALVCRFHRGTQPCYAKAGWNWSSWLHYGTRRPLGQPGAVERWVCLADLLLAALSDKTASGMARSTMLVLILLCFIFFFFFFSHVIDLPHLHM